ncbi:MAG TPA: MBOAT family O-acyltransferase [Phycisphaerales bacterium]|nr:MBOAT family O-acyltransferase [Phycisphaerales bacterium]
MLFHSVAFVVFFVIVYGLYLALQGRTPPRPRSPRFIAQNLVLLAASLVFYGWWDWRFLLLMLATAGVDHLVSVRIVQSDRASRRRLLLLVSLISNLGVLGFFKYFNFFAESVAEGLSLLGIEAHPALLRVALPVGISFYTFQSLSYTIDVYRGRMRPARSIFSFWLFVSFFPQLVAGPIERATHLLPQVENPRRIDPAQVDLGVWLILWGFFKKLVVADNLAIVANAIFAHPERATGPELYLGAVAFAGQIYGDFSAYSDIARGLCKLMGFDLMLNFRIPYAATSPSDFWNRWHISLSTWLRDYLYIPLGGNRRGTVVTQRNLMLTMLLGGLWHGAAWNYVLWGAFHGLVLVAYRPFQRRIDRVAAPSSADPTDRTPPPGCRGLQLALLRLVMFHLVLVGWILFRCRSLQEIGGYFRGLFAGWSTLAEALAGTHFADVAFFAAPIVLMELWQHRTGDLSAPTRLSLAPRALLYTVLLAAMMVWGVRDAVEFIYFQF